MYDGWWATWMSLEITVPDMNALQLGNIPSWITVTSTSEERLPGIEVFAITPHQLGATFASCESRVNLLGLRTSRFGSTKQKSLRTDCPICLSSDFSVFSTSEDLSVDLASKLALFSLSITIYLSRTLSIYGQNLHGRGFNSWFAVRNMIFHSPLW